MVPYVVGISGPSRAGKSTLAEGLCDRLCGPNAARQHHRGDKRCLNRVVQFIGTKGVKLSYICQDSFFFGGMVIEELNDMWDVPEALDHDAVLLAVEHESRDPGVHFVIFEGFKAYHDERVMEHLDLCLWVEAPRELVRQRRLKNKRCTPEEFDNVIWANHLKYKEQAFMRQEAGRFMEIDGSLPIRGLLERALECILLGLEQHGELKAFLAARAHAAWPQQPNLRAHEYRARAAALNGGATALRHAGSRSRSVQRRTQQGLNGLGRAGAVRPSAAGPPRPCPKSKLLGNRAPPPRPCSSAASAREAVLGFWQRKGLLRPPIEKAGAADNQRPAGLEDAIPAETPAPSIGQRRTRLKAEAAAESPTPTAVQPLVQLKAEAVAASPAPTAVQQLVQLKAEAAAEAPAPTLVQPQVPLKDEAQPLMESKPLMCANPNCWFLVPEGMAYGGYCCVKCHWRQVSGSKPQKKHEASCAKVFAPDGCPRAEPIPPREPYCAEAFGAAEAVDGDEEGPEEAPGEPAAEAGVLRGIFEEEPLQPEEIRNTQLRCANPECTFRVHDDRALGGYCCRECHHGCTLGLGARHGPDCQRREATIAWRALDLPPHGATVGLADPAAECCRRPANPPAPPAPVPSMSPRRPENLPALPVPPAPVPSMSPKIAKARSRMLGCANPNCWFLIHEDEDYGGFCCSKCHWRWQTGKTVNKKHEACCGKVPFEDEGMPRAKPVPPRILYEATA